MRSSLSPRIARTIIAPLCLALLLAAWVAVRRAYTVQLQTTMDRNLDFARSLAVLARQGDAPDAPCRAAPATTRIMRLHMDTLALVCDSEQPFASSQIQVVSGKLAEALRTARPTLRLQIPHSGDDVAVAIAPIPGTSQALVVATDIRPAAAIGSSLTLAALLALALALLAVLAAYRLDLRLSMNFHSLRQSLRRQSARASLPDFARLQSELDQRMRELSALTDAALEQRDELNFILDSMPESVLIFDRDRRLLRYNEAARKLLELRGSEGNGQVIESVIRHNGLIRFVDSVLLSRDAAFRETTLEWNNRTSYEASGVQVEWAGLHKAIVVLRDLTASRRLEQIKTDFVSNASHELQTPLTAIRGYAETLLDGAHDDNAVRLKFLDSIHRHAVRLEALVKDLLALAHIERDESSLELTLQPLRPVSESVVDLMALRVGETGAYIDNRIAPDIQLRLNARLFEQALLNLVENALRYSPRGSTVVLRTRQEPSQIIVEVRDNGPGIAAEHLPRLFERFYRVDPARSRSLGGTGLGLAIVKHVALAHGGTVSVQSQPGQGSCFCLCLPLA